MLLADPSLKILVIALVPKPLGGKLDNSLGRWITRWAIGHGGLVFSHQARPQGNPIPFLYYLLSLLRQYSQWCGKPGCVLLAAGLWLVVGRLRLPAVCCQKSSAPFSWTATAAAIPENLQRLCSQVSGTCH